MNCEHCKPLAFYCGEGCPGDQTCEETKWCMCGSEVEHHDFGSGHSPVSVHDYCSRPDYESYKKAVDS